jgi:urease
MVFVSQISVDSGKIDSYKLKKRVEPVKNCRNVSKKDMKLNDAMPLISVDPETYAVTADGVECVCDPVSSLPMTQSIYLF